MDVLGALGAPSAARLGDPTGVRSLAGDGYYGVRVSRPGRPDAIAFLIVDQEGAAGPDVCRWASRSRSAVRTTTMPSRPRFGLQGDGVPPADRDLL